MNKTLLAASLLALSGLSSIAAAAPSDNWFVRGDLGRSTLSVNGFSGSSSGTSGGIGGGYYFTPNFAVEGFYKNFGTRNDGLGDSVKLDGWGLGLVGKKDFGPNNTGFFIDGRLGIFFNQTKVNVSGVGSANDNSQKIYVGVGAGYDFTKNFGLSLNYDYTRFNAFGLSGNANSVGGALEARF